MSQEFPNPKPQSAADRVAGDQRQKGERRSPSSQEDWCQENDNRGWTIKPGCHMRSRKCSAAGKGPFWSSIFLTPVFLTPKRFLSVGGNASLGFALWTFAASPRYLFPWPHSSAKDFSAEECQPPSQSFDFESPVLDDFGALLSDFVLESDFVPESGFDEAASDADLSAFAASL